MGHTGLRGRGCIKRLMYWSVTRGEDTEGTMGWGAYSKGVT